MLEDLLVNNKLQYVCIEQGCNVVVSMTVAFNIQNLRFFDIRSDTCRVDIILDITQEYPSQLQVYSVQYGWNE